ncbi:hypothetical protein JYU34_005127 [Plutella xylostella]|uniref:Abasic site processing protein HMCES n=1 Tax=Plutella xylostella TaxID=51655 RepID=A0ABQ7QW11_PLUXY|nr:hypothetical protein JYU34_005127 [Plutella xylostella]
MCGRTVLSLNKNDLRHACSYKPKGCKSYKKPDWSDEHNDGKTYSPSHNIAPTDVTPVLVSSSQFRSDSENERILKPMMWGIIPPWHTGDYKKHNLSTNNCRLENIKSSKLYGPALQKGGRCVVVMEGFYEWQTTDKSSKTKQPYYIYTPQKDSTKMDDPETWSTDYDEETGWEGINLLYVAAIYSVWKHEDVIIYSYSVITMDSNSTLDWLHHRMPAVLDTPEQIEAWLDVDNVNPDLALTYLKPVKMLCWHPVSTAVNNSRYKSEDCNNRVTVTKPKSAQKSLTAFFTKVEKRKSTGTDSNEIKRRKNNAN